MKKLINTVIITLALTLTTLYASNGQNYYRYGDIDTKLNKRAILEIAKQELRRLVLEKKIPKSWKSKQDFKIEKNHSSSSNSWIVSFNNKKIKKVKKQTINILVDIHGNIKGAAYSSH